MDRDLNDDALDMDAALEIAEEEGEPQDWEEPRHREKRWRGEPS